MSICGLADELSGFYDVAVFHLIAHDFFLDLRFCFSGIESLQRY